MAFEMVLASVLEQDSTGLPELIIGLLISITIFGSDGSSDFLILKFSN